MIAVERGGGDKSNDNDSDDDDDGSVGDGGNRRRGEDIGINTTDAGLVIDTCCGHWIQQALSYRPNWIACRTKIASSNASASKTHTHTHTHLRIYYFIISVFSLCFFFAHFSFSFIINITFMCFYFLHHAQMLQISSAETRSYSDLHNI